MEPLSKKEKFEKFWSVLEKDKELINFRRRNIRRGFS